MILRTWKKGLLGFHLKNGNGTKGTIDCGSFGFGMVAPYCTCRMVELADMFELF